LLDLPTNLGDRDMHRRRSTRGTGTVVILGATVLPVDPAFSAHEAIAIRGNRILAVGTEDEVRAAAGEDAQVIDRPGATILPGFIEPHATCCPPRCCARGTTSARSASTPSTRRSTT
jgi:adenine deaminase